MNKTLIQQSILITSFILALTGCEVGPDYHEPQNSLPSDWKSNQDQPGSDKVEIEQLWWKNFNDPVLSQLIDKADTENFDLKIAEARIVEARANVSSATASLLPSGSVQGSAEREANQIAFPDSSTSPFGSLLKKPFNTFQTGFDASWELDLFGGNRRSEESAEAQMQASEASRDDVRVSLLAEVARTYISIRQTQAQIEIEDKIIEANKKTREIAQQRFQAGEDPRLDVTQASSVLEQAQTQLPMLRNQLAQAEFSMDVLLGAEPGVAHSLVNNSAPMPVVSKTLVPAAPAAVIAQRPDIRVAERKLAAATAQQGVAVAQFFPKISLSGFFGVLNTSTSKLITPGNQSWMGEGSVIWPILSYGTLSANLDAANAQQQEAIATYQKTIISALSDVERSLTAYNEQDKFLQSLAAQEEHDQHARDIAQERYKEGLTSLREVLDADRTLYNTQSELIKARSDYIQNLIAVYKSLGGGWVKG
jgi:multidrug efflux system outer membrane protein